MPRGGTPAPSGNLAGGGGAAAARDNAGSRRRSMRRRRRKANKEGKSMKELMMERKLKY